MRKMVPAMAALADLGHVGIDAQRRPAARGVGWEMILLLTLSLAFLAVAVGVVGRGIWGQQL